MAKPASSLGEIVATDVPRERTPARGAPGELWSRHGYILLAVLAGLGFLGIWELLARLAIIEPVLFPPPSRTAASWWSLVREDFFLRHFTVTVYEIVAGFLLGSSIGIILGTLLAMVRLIRLTLYPYIIAFQALPKVVLAPLFIVWFGFGPASKIATAAAICFFPVLVNTLVGLRSADDDAVKLFRSLRASGRQTFVKLLVPTALPYIFAGLKISLTFAMTGAIAAEFLTGAADGLGRLVQIYNQQIRVDLALAVVVIVSALGIVGVWLMDTLDRRIVFWRKDRGRSVS